MGGAAIGVELLTVAIKAGLQLYQAQGMSEAQARAMVERDMGRAATNAGMATVGWRARKRPKTIEGDGP